MAKVEMVPVQSSNLESVGYIESTGTLVVKFRRNGSKRSNPTYYYKGVVPTKFRGLLNAKSPGRFFQTEIRDQYVFSKHSGWRPRKPKA